MNKLFNKRFKIFFKINKNTNKKKTFNKKILKILKEEIMKIN